MGKGSPPNGEPFAIIWVTALIPATSLCFLFNRRSLCEVFSMKTTGKCPKCGSTENAKDGLCLLTYAQGLLRVVRSKFAFISSWILVPWKGSRIRPDVCLDGGFMKLYEDHSENSSSKVDRRQPEPRDQRLKHFNRMGNPKDQFFAPGSVSAILRRCGSGKWRSLGWHECSTSLRGPDSHELASIDRDPFSFGSFRQHSPG